MKKVNFISRHAAPSNLPDLLAKPPWAGVEISHVTDSVSDIIPNEGELNIAVAPTAMFLEAASHLVNKVAGSLLSNESYSVATLVMKRPERPKEGEKTLPPTEVEKLVIFSVVKEDGYVFTDYEEIVCE